MVIYHDLLFSKTITNNMFFFPFEIMQTLSLVMNMCIYIYIYSLEHYSNQTVVIFFEVE